MNREYEKRLLRTINATNDTTPEKTSVSDIRLSLSVDKGNTVCVCSRSRRPSRALTRMA